jgi:hypothetical protein
MSDYRIEAATKEEWAERALRAEAKLEALTKAATKVHHSYWHSTDGVITGMYDLERALRLAELKGETDA